jgi:RimJ/RimL family protein N-acetyltransferase
MELAERDRTTGARVRLTILEPSSNDCRGRLSVHNIDWNDARAELGIWLAPQARGRGLASGALRLAARWLFEECGLQHLQLFTEPENEAMIRAATAAGFTEDGKARRGSHDMMVLSLVRDDFSG